MSEITLKQKKKNDSDEKILDAAIKVFGRNGYSNASLTAIAAEAGVSQSLVSQRYQSKDNLFFEAFKPVVEPLYRLMNAETSLQAIFDNILDFFQKSCAEEPDNFAFFEMFVHSFDIPSEIHAYAKRHYEETVLHKLIVIAQGEGMLPRSDSWELINVFFGYSVTLINWYHNSKIEMPENKFFLMSLRYSPSEEEAKIFDSYNQIKKIARTKSGDVAERVENRRLLLVEDNELNRQMTAELLEDKGFAVDEAEDGSVAVEILREKGPDYYTAILMDIQMPVMDGYKATMAIRSMYPHRRLPIIAVSANTSEEDIKKSLESGMDDHIAKPIKIEELLDAILKTMTSSIERDSLTGIKNRNAYSDAVSALDRSIEQGTVTPFAVVMCDINNLKETNDEFGHDSGDQLIKTSAKFICSTFQHSPVFRIGGDEFVAILKNSDYEQRNQLVSMFKEQSEKNIPINGTIVACGMSEFSPEDKSVNDVFVRADREMYIHKDAMKAMGRALQQ